MPQRHGTCLYCDGQTTGLIGTMEVEMPNRLFGIALTAMTLAAALPTTAAAQRSSRIQATARVVGSVLPETQAAAEQQIAQLAGPEEPSIVAEKHTVATSKGIAHIVTESWPVPDPIGDLEDNDRPAVASGQTEVRITVAYTAN